MRGGEIMEGNNSPRIRINAKQKSSGEWYFDITAETNDVEDSSSLLLDAAIKVQNKFKEAGKNIVVDTG